MKRFIIMIVAVLAVSVLWMAAWFYVAGRIEAEIAVFAQADGVTQPRLECADLSVGGAPFSFTPRCRTATITAADTTVTLDGITGTALFYRPFHIQLFATGPARITDAFSGASQEVTWSNLHASVRLGGGSLERFSAVADDLVYSDTLMGQTELGTAGHAEAHLIDATPADPQPGTGRIYDFYTAFEDLQSVPLDIANGTVTLDGQLSGLPEPVLWSDPLVLAYWQALGGQLTLRGLEASADGLALSAIGEAGLTENGLVEGTLEIESEGVTGRIAALADDSVAQIVLGSPNAEGVSTQRLTINDGTVVVGILPVAALPPLF